MNHVEVLGALERHAELADVGSERLRDGRVAAQRAFRRGHQLRVGLGIAARKERHVVPASHQLGAEKIIVLLREPETRRAFGRAGQEQVRRQFLLPRLVRDDLHTMRRALSSKDGATRSAA